MDAKPRPAQKKKQTPRNCVVDPNVYEHDIAIPGHIRLSLAIKTISEANCGEPWQARLTRKRLQRDKVIKNLKPFLQFIRLPCDLTLTRYAPGTLDEHDNLRMAFKKIMDTVCDLLIPGLPAGIADSDSRINKKYAQQKSKTYFIAIEIKSTSKD